MNKEIPFFSILIPVYNVENYIRECIYSVLQQTYKNYEIILVNDGSTDSSSEICDEFARNYENICVIHKQNEGLMMARKDGIKNSCADYLIFLDSDDELSDENVLADLKSVIINNASEVVIFTHNKYFKNKKEFVQLSHQNQLEKGSFKNISNREFWKLFVKGGYNSLTAKAIKRTLVPNDYEKIYKKVNCAEDAIQTVYYLKNAEKITLYSRDCFNYRFRKGSLVHKKTYDSFLESVDVENHLYDVLCDYQCLDGQDIKNYFTTCANYLLDDLFKIHCGKGTIISKSKNMDIIFDSENCMRILNSCSSDKLGYNKYRYQLLMKNKRKLLLFVDDLLFLIKRLSAQFSRRIPFD